MTLILAIGTAIFQDTSNLDAPIGGLLCDNQIIVESHISATVAARRFSDLLNRVYYRGEEFVVERGGQPVCRIVPARPGRFTLADLATRLASIPKPDKGYWDAVESASKSQPPVPKSAWPR